MRDNAYLKLYLRSRKPFKFKDCQLGITDTAALKGVDDRKH